MNLQNIVSMTEEKIKRITAQDLMDLFPMLTTMESETLGKAVRNDLKLAPSVYYSLIGKTIEAIIVALQERAQ